MSMVANAGTLQRAITKGKTIRKLESRESPPTTPNSSSSVLPTSLGSKKDPGDHSDRTESSKGVDENDTTACNRVKSQSTSVVLSELSMLANAGTPQRTMATPNNLRILESRRKVESTAPHSSSSILPTDLRQNNSGEYSERVQKEDKQKVGNSDSARSTSKAPPELPDHQKTGTIILPPSSKDAVNGRGGYIQQALVVSKQTTPGKSKRSITITLSEESIPMEEEQKAYRFQGFHPQSPFITKWEVLMLLMHVLVLFVAPALVAFDSMDGKFVIFASAITVLYTADTIIQVFILSSTGTEEKILSFRE
ncbi:hypothetical protein HDU67_005354, partial [Dinochytrium kinnereticum]